MTSQLYWPASVMASGLIASVEVNGYLELDGEDMETLSLEIAGVHCTVRFTSVSTVGCRVAVQVNVTALPS